MGRIPNVTPVKVILWNQMSIGMQNDSFYMVMTDLDNRVKNTMNT